MFDLEIINKNGILVVDSRVVAKELGVEHKNLLVKIDGYIGKFTKAESLALIKEYYIEDTYRVNGNFKEYRMYWITRKGIAQLISGYNDSVPIAFALNIAYIEKFDKMEKELSNKPKLPTTYKEALIELLAKVEENEKLQSKIEEDKPRVEYYNKVLDTSNEMTTTVVAKSLGISAQALNRFLHNEGIIYKQSDSWFFYTKYQDKGYGTIATVTYTNKEGVECTKHYLKWTEKGREFIINLWNNKEY